MRVHEIAKRANVDKEVVRDFFGIEDKQGYHQVNVDDEQAIAYIEQTTGDVFSAEDEEQAKPSGRVRFWSPRKSLTVCRPGETVIEFDNHAFVCDEGSEEAELLRDPGQRDSLREYEVLLHPHKDITLQRRFMQYLEEQIYTGIDVSEGPSVSGRDAVKRILPEEMLAELPSDVKNPVQPLVEAVVDRVSLNVEVYPLEKKS